MPGISKKDGDPHETRARLIAHGLSAMLRHGYDGVGIGGILSSAGVPKGSFYHFFASKEAFALAVLDAYQAHYAAMRQAIFTDRTRPALDRLVAWLDALEHIHRAETPLGGCFYGVLAQTATVRTEGLRSRLAAVFALWQTELAQLLEDARETGETDPALDADETAALIIDCYEGMLVRAKTDPAALSAGFARLRRLAQTPGLIMMEV
jgi:TetR/AcrR family transcriptional repressor of nem operon